MDFQVFARGTLYILLPLTDAAHDLIDMGMKDSTSTKLEIRGV
jgi:hypothetical protein